MTKATPFVDFRDFRPTAVLIVDLVKHSRREKAQIHSVQGILVSVFKDAMRRLELSGICFNYAGDGYVVAFPGDLSARILDFINVAFPELIQRLAQYDQHFRAGVDFGLIHLSNNPLTQSLEHFDLPGIQASRLESSAAANQILCSETIFQLFGHHYPSMFDKEAVAVTTKDRAMDAYVLHPVGFTDVRQHFEDYILGKPAGGVGPVGDRRRILIVEDHAIVLDALVAAVGREFPTFVTEGAADGYQALTMFSPGNYALVVTDEMMPGLRGSQLTARLAQVDGELPIVMLTALPAATTAKEFFAAGGSGFLQKSGRMEDLLQGLHRCFGTNLALVRQKLHILTPDIGGLLLALQEIADEFRVVIADAANSKDLAGSLLRHKAKEVVFSFLETVLPGNDVAGYLEQLRVQLQCVKRLLRAVGGIRSSSLEEHLSAYAGDMGKLNPKLNISVTCDFGGTNVHLSYAGILTLIVCEFIDNSIAALRDEAEGEIAVRIVLLPAAQLLQLTVEDSGPGVPAEIRDSMFERGVSTKGSGRGLGLCLIREAVLTLKGGIEYAENGGAVFSITLPSKASECCYGWNSP